MVHQYGWLCKQDEENRGRRNRAESRYHYLSAGETGRLVYNVTRILRPNKDPHAEICMARTYTHTRTRKTPRRTVERRRTDATCRLMKIRVKTRDLRLKRRSRA